MTPFRFRLERVRLLRQQAERAAQEELAASLGRRSEGERSLADADAAVDAARGSARTAATSSTARSGSDLVAAAAYLDRVSTRRASAERELRARDADVDGRREALTAAARGRQVLDRLRGRRRAEHERAAERSEAARLDELALAVHRRKGRAA